MSSSTELPRPSLPSLLSSCFQFTKQLLRDACMTASPADPDLPYGEKSGINAAAGEMQQFGTFDQRGGGGGGEFDEFGGGGGGDKISKYQAGWNVTNAIQGMFLVSLPYAVLHGGYWAVVAMCGVAWICCYTGKILVDCLYEEDENGLRVRVRSSYMDIAAKGFGEMWGPKVVVSAQLVELLMTCILYVVLCGDLLVATFPDSPIDSRSWMMLCGMVLLPCAFLRNLHAVSTLSFYCTVAHFLINLIVVAYCLSAIGQWDFSKVTLTIDGSTFPISLGIIVFSYTSHIFLPTLEGNMASPAEFAPMLEVSHVAAAAFKSGFGFICFLTWGKSTLQVITNNLPTFWKVLVNLILVVKAVLSYPLPYYAAADLIQDVFGYTPYDRHQQLTTKGLSFRVGVVVLTILFAVSIPHFSILMGFIGNFTGTMLSFIWPCVFHLKLKGGQLQVAGVALDCFIIFLGVVFGIIGIYDSGEALVEAYQIGLPF